jgi:hypothetical protein
LKYYAEVAREDYNTKRRINKPAAKPRSKKTRNPVRTCRNRPARVSKAVEKFL